MEATGTKVRLELGAGCGFEGHELFLADAAIGISILGSLLHH